MNNNLTNKISYFGDEQNKELQAHLRYQQFRQRMYEAIEQKQANEELKQEIIADILNHVAINLNDQAIKELRDILKNILK